eukprot:CAMPEP_0201584526 /NCGR_PEP_ID=MMETSP0190_2-20130828/111708_1 /ASSEMBLY_ACC=CAM_ASM_000263 /TAXON_ID=37353 /ORGANISM="Rosalina sp." /LENGTH=69 /DNA_ID=CAMNT_0048028677 /DNA_START=346 /DNA_END=552 /DNA_ORIENTATION=+
MSTTEQPEESSMRQKEPRLNRAQTVQPKKKQSSKKKRPKQIPIHNGSKSSKKSHIGSIRMSQLYRQRNG